MASPGDSLTVAGTSMSVATYTAGAFGAGEIVIDGQTISFTGIEEQVSARRFQEFTLVVPDRLDDLWVRDAGDGETSISDQSNPADGPGVFFALLDSDPGYVDADAHLTRGDAGLDVFVISPQTALPALTRGESIINGASQQALTGESNPFGPEVVLDGSEIRIITDRQAVSLGIVGAQSPLHCALLAEMRIFFLDTVTLSR